MGSFGNGDGVKTVAQPIFLPWGRWQLESNQTHRRCSGQRHFGFSVSISGDTAIVRLSSTTMGAIAAARLCFYPRSQWHLTQTTKLTAADAEGGERFGYSVAISGDTAIVGARDDDDGGDRAALPIFLSVGPMARESNNQTHRRRYRGRERFGYSVAISGDTAIVGAKDDDDGGDRSGSGYFCPWSRRRLIKPPNSPRMLRLVTILAARYFRRHRRCGG